MKNKQKIHYLIGVQTRICRKSDYVFVYGLVKKTIFPFVSQFVKPNKKIFDRRFFAEYKKTIILLRGKRRIGLYELTANGKNLTISRILLSPFYQKKGIGKYLMGYFETLGFNRIQLSVWKNNPAVGFYKNLGYKIIKKENNKYLMEKRI